MTNQERLQANNAKIEAIQDALKNKVGTSGEIEIVENGKYDVSKYASAKVDVPLGYPLEIATSVEMGAVIIDNNIGKVYKYVGETNDTYTQGDFYIVEAE